MGKYMEPNMDKDNRSLQAARGILHDPLAGMQSCRFLKLRRGQQVIEYAIVLSVVSAIFLGMFIYGRRGLSAIIKKQADVMCPQKHFTPTSVIYDERADAQLVKDDKTSASTNKTESGIQKTSAFSSRSSGVRYETEQEYY